MSENSTAATDLASQYAAQVTGDLERNAREQERIDTDIATLREQLAILRRDQAVLLSMREALGVASPPAEPAPSSAPSSAPLATVPGPRTETAPGRAGKGTRAKKTPAAAPAPAKPRPTSKRASDPKGGKAAAAAGNAPAKTTGKVSAKAAVTAPETASPTLVELVRAHLTEQGEPRSAAEVAVALGRVHADRPFKTTVVRNTLENLVGRGQAQRGKQGSSVFYAAPDRADQKAGTGTGTGTAEAEAEAGTERSE